MPLRGKVTTGDGILKELYEISARYQATGRPRYTWSESANVHSPAELWVHIELELIKLDSISTSIVATPDMVRSALLDLATIAVSWAREIREHPTKEGTQHEGT